MASARQVSFQPVRRVRTLLSVVISVAAAIAIVGLLNYLAVTRKVWRIRISQPQAEALSPLTLQTLGAQTNALRIVVLFDPENDLYPHVDGLLREYAARSPHIQIQTIDYLRNPGAALNAKARYRLGAGATDLIIFDAGDSQRVVTAGELSVYNSEDTQAIMAGEDREIRRSGFSGEYHFTAAIAALQEKGETKAAYLLGHGEHLPDSQEPLMGYAKFAELLTGEKNLRLESVKLAGATNQIPADCQLLIIAGPTTPLAPRELDKIEAFLQRGGRLLALLHPYSAERPSGLEELLQRWGVAAPPAYAGDEENTYTKLDVHTQSFGSHPLVAPLRRASGALYFPLPRVVAPMPPNQMPADAPKAEILVTTSEAGFTRSNIKGGNVAFDPAKDARSTTVPIAAVAERGGVAGVAAGRGATRIVAIGDSTMFANETLGKPQPDGGNRDFAGLVVSWLLDRPQSMAIGPKPIREYRLSLTARQQSALRWTLVAGIPGAILLMGMTVWYRRRD